MRTLLASLALALVALFATAEASAQSTTDCGVNWAPRGSFAVQSDLEAAAMIATRLGDVHWRETPGQSRAPIACDDPNDPRCQLEQADPPHRGLTLDAVYGDGAVTPSVTVELPEAGVRTIEFPDVSAGGPRVAFESELLRPPSR